MKKTLLLLGFLCLLNFPAIRAQINKGNLILGVSSALGLAGTGTDLMTIGYSVRHYKSDADGYEEPDPDTRLSFNLLPKVGYFVIDNLAVGFDICMASTIEKDGEDDDKNTTTLFSAGPFMRYYLPCSKVHPFLEFGGTYGIIKDKYEGSYNEESKYDIMSFGGGAGIAMPVGNRASIDIMANYLRLSEKAKENNDDNFRIVYGTFGLKLGIVVFIGKK